MMSFASSLRSSRGLRWTTIWPRFGPPSVLDALPPIVETSACDVRVPADDVGDVALIFDELVVRRALRGFGRHRDLIGVLIGNEALRHDDEEDAGEHEDDGERRHRRAAMPEDDLQRPIVAAEHRLEVALGRPPRTATSAGACSAAAAVVARCLGFFRKRLQSIGVSVTDTTPEIRIDDADRDRELAEQPAEHAAHEEHRE